MDAQTIAFAWFVLFLYRIAVAYYGNIYDKIPDITQESGTGVVQSSAGLSTARCFSMSTRCSPDAVLFRVPCVVDGYAKNLEIIMTRDEIDSLKERLDIVDVVSNVVSLKKSGSNWKGLCPFHNEKTPSFTVSSGRQFFHCFGCGESGDVFGFVQKIRGVDFKEAFRRLQNYSSRKKA